MTNSSSCKASNVLCLLAQVRGHGIGAIVKDLNVIVDAVGGALQAEGVEGQPDDIPIFHSDDVYAVHAMGVALRVGR